MSEIALINITAPINTTDNWTCPTCKTFTRTERVPRSKAVKVVLFWLPLKRYMCYKCKRKYYTIEKK